LKLAGQLRRGVEALPALGEQANRTEVSPELAIETVSRNPVSGLSIEVDFSINAAKNR